MKLTGISNLDQSIADMDSILSGLVAAAKKINEDYLVEECTAITDPIGYEKRKQESEARLQIERDAWRRLNPPANSQW